MSIRGAKQRKEYILDDNGDKIYDSKKRQYKCKSIPSTDWNEQTKAEEWRAIWADIQNRYLERYGHDTRVDHRSYDRQSKEAIPSTQQDKDKNPPAQQSIEIIPSIKLGVAAYQMEQRGIITDRGNMNREIEISNRKLRRIEEQIHELQGWLDEERARPWVQPMPQSHSQTQSHKQSSQQQFAKAPHSTTPHLPAESHSAAFADVISDILSQRGQVYSNPETATYILDFLKSNQIEDYTGLESHLKNLMRLQRETSQKFNPVRIKLKKLTEHLKQHEAYIKYKVQYKQYQHDYNNQQPWKKKSFEQEHDWLIKRYNDSLSYIDGVRNDKNQIPINAWQKEHSELSAELQKLNGEYQSLKTQVDEVNKIRVKVYDILRKEKQVNQPSHKRPNNIGR